MGVMVFDRQKVIVSDPVYATARDHALRLAGYANPAKHHNRIARVRVRDGQREFYVWRRVQA